MRLDVCTSREETIFPLKRATLGTVLHTTCPCYYNGRSVSCTPAGIFFCTLGPSTFRRVHYTDSTRSCAIGLLVYIIFSTSPSPSLINSSDFLVNQAEDPDRPLFLGFARIVWTHIKISVSHGRQQGRLVKVRDLFHNVVRERYLIILLLCCYVDSALGFRYIYHRRWCGLRSIHERF